MNPLSKFLVKAYAEAAEDSASELTMELRDFAKDLGWPAEVSSHLRVSIEDGEYVVQYPPMFKNSILTLEYGTQAIPPAPAIRTFLQELYQTNMEAEIEKHLKKARLI